MMDTEYSQSNKRVNTESNFTFDNQSNKFQNMTFSERLIAAMAHKRIDQTKLAEVTGISQPTISKITRGETESSTFTVQLAVACGVRPEWLAMESGEMVDGLYVQDERIKTGVHLLEQLRDEYLLDDAIKMLDIFAKRAPKTGDEKQ